MSVLDNVFRKLGLRKPMDAAMPKRPKTSLRDRMEYSTHRDTLNRWKKSKFYGDDLIEAAIQDENPGYWASQDLYRKAKNKRINDYIQDYKQSIFDAKENGKKRIPLENKLSQRETDPQLIKDKYIEELYNRMAEHPTTELNDVRNRLVDAASRGFTDEDMFDIIKNPETLSLITNNKQAKDAMLELLENRDNDVLHAYNRATGGSILREDWKNRPMVEAREAAEKSAAQSEIDNMIPKPRFDESYVGGFGNDVAPERSGMSAVGKREMGNPLRQRMVEYYERKGDNTLSDIDELLMSNLTNKELGKSKRLAKSMRDESARLSGGLQGKTKERLSKPFNPVDEAVQNKKTKELKELRLKNKDKTQYERRETGLRADEYLEQLEDEFYAERDQYNDFKEWAKQQKPSAALKRDAEEMYDKLSQKRKKIIDMRKKGIKRFEEPRSDVEYIFDNMEGADKRSFMDYKPERKDPWVEWIDNKAKRKGTYYDQAEHKEELRKILEARANEIKKSGKGSMVPVEFAVRGMSIPTGVKVNELDVLRQSYPKKQKTPKFKNMSESELEMRKKTKASQTDSDRLAKQIEYHIERDENNKLLPGYYTIPGNKKKYTSWEDAYATLKSKGKTKLTKQSYTSRRKKFVDESLVEEITKTIKGKKVPYFRIRGSMVNGKYREFRRLKDALAYLQRQIDE